MIYLTNKMDFFELKQLSADQWIAVLTIMSDPKILPFLKDRDFIKAVQNDSLDYIPDAFLQLLKTDEFLVRTFQGLLQELSFTIDST